MNKTLDNIVSKAQDFGNTVKNSAAKVVLPVALGIGAMLYSGDADAQKYVERKTPIYANVVAEREGTMRVKDMDAPLQVTQYPYDLVLVERTDNQKRYVLFVPQDLDWEKGQEYVFDVVGKKNGSVIYDDTDLDDFMYRSISCDDLDVKASGIAIGVNYKPTIKEPYQSKSF